MKKKYLFIMLFLLIPTQYAQADFKEKMRDLVEKYLGDEVSTSIFGEKPEKIILPKIPKINSSAKSLDVYKKSEKLDIKPLDPEVERKSNLNFIVEVYKVTRNKKPDNQTIAQWINVLTQGGTREGLYRALVLDSTYAGLENFGDSVDKEVVDFTLAYLSEFLDRESSAESIEKSNLYTLKRVMTEKTLEVLDEYVMLADVDSLYRWYAVFSAEMAKKFPTLWINKLRASQVRVIHYNWAKTVPIQHIKSEVIIKIHKILNNLK